jgi:hypothetical protein
MIAKSYIASLPPAQRRAGLELARDWRIEHGLPVRERPDESGAQPVVEVRPGPKRRPDVAQTAPDGSPASATSADAAAPSASESPEAAPTSPIEAHPSESAPPAAGA